MKLLRGFVMFVVALPAFAQYAGPAILSRGEAPAALTVPSVDFSFSLALTANYTTGLSGVLAPNAQGQLANQSGEGGGVTLGASGAHSWRHTHLGLSYSGSFTDYFNASYFAGFSQGLSLGLSHQLTRHLSLSVRENAGMFTQFPPATVALNSSVPFDPSQSQIPTTDFYDNRTIYNSTQAGLNIQASTRLSFSLGGGFFDTFRRSSALYGATGESGSADVQYRFSRKLTFGATYGFSHYSYTGSIGGSQIHSVGLEASERFSRSVEMSMFAGASRVSSSFEQILAIDPAILAILCPPTLVSACPLVGGTVLNNNVFWGPNFGIRVSRSFQRGSVYLTAGESITPGNGLFLTSRAASASVGYGYSGLRKWSLNIGVTYLTALSLANVQGGYGQIGGSFGMSRQLAGRVSFVSSLSAWQYQSNTFTAYNRLIYSASIGLGFSSKNIPVRFF